MTGIIIGGDAFTFVALLKACARMKDVHNGTALHADILRRGLLKRTTSGDSSHYYLTCTLISMYARCGALAKAHQLLEELPIRNVTSWNALISGYAQHGQAHKALQCFEKMQKEGFLPDAVTFICILKVCGQTRAIEQGIEIHDRVVRTRLLEKYVVLGNVLMDMYIRCKEVAKAHEVLEQLPIRDAVSWNVIIAGYAQHEQCCGAVNCLEQMQSEGLSPDAITFICVLKACGRTGDARKGKVIHDEIMRRGLLEKDIMLGTALATMYTKCDMLAKAYYVIQCLPERDIVSWNALITGYTQHGECYKSLNCFEQLENEGLFPDIVTFICILKACGGIRAIEKGKQIHSKVMSRSLLEEDVMLGTALVDMYAKCGMLQKAQNVLEDLPTRNVVSWNALIAGYTQWGHIHEALTCFEWMQNEGLSPDLVTFICILKACSSIGAIDEGEKIHDMIVNRGLMRKDVVLCNALVDMYAKCGMLARAKEVLEELPVRDVISWNALIAGYAEQGQGHDALCCYERMQNDGVSPDVITFICSLKACGITGDRDKGSKIHEDIMSRGLLEKDLLLTNALIDMYAKCGLFTKAKQILERLHFRNVISWSSLIAGYAQQGQGHEALDCFERMKNEGISPDTVTFICVLKACGTVGAVGHGKQIHNQIISMGLIEKDIILGTTLVDMYAKCGMLVKAQHVIEQLPIRNVISWSSLIAGYAQQGQGHRAVNCYEWMQSEGLCPNVVTFISILKACGSTGDIDKGKQIHDIIVGRGLLEKDILLATALLDMYARCGFLVKAREVLEELPIRDVISWNALIAGYAQQGKCEEALNCLEWMQSEGFCPNVITLISILKACGSRGTIRKGKEIHAIIMGMGWLENDITLGNSLVDMYARCDDLENAQQLLEELPLKDAVSWNSLITGYAQAGKALEAMNCLVQMQNEGLSPDPVTFTCILKACSITRAIEKGKEIHNQIVDRGLLEKDSVLGNALVDMYAKCGLLAKALEVCEELPLQDVVSWSTLIAAYAQQGQAHEALNCFERMKSAGVEPNVVTLICTLKACGSAGALDNGKQIHEEIVSNGLLWKDPMLGNALVDMYAKCGMLAKARQVLEELPNRDLVSWNALIAGHAQQREGHAALKCFERMQSEGLSPDDITFVCILTACSHAGLVDKAQMLFDDMTRKYGVVPTIEHHTCMVAVFGCVGYFDQAMSVIKVMPCSNHPAVWLALLCACKRWGNVRLGKVAFDQVVQLDDGCAGAYVLMATIFLDAGMQEDARQVEAMRCKYASRKGEDDLLICSHIWFPAISVENMNVGQYKLGAFSEQQSYLFERTRGF